MLMYKISCVIVTPAIAFHFPFNMRKKLNAKSILSKLYGSFGIAPTFIKLDAWSLGAGFIPIISTKGINQIKKGKLLEKS